MSVRTPAWRWLVISLAAYALVLHSLAMGVAASPRTSVDNTLMAALQDICTGMSGAERGPATPGSSKLHSAPCALCGLGHAAVDLPALALVPPPVNIIETIAQEPPAAAARPRLEFLAAARPRAPPAFV